MQMEPRLGDARDTRITKAPGIIIPIVCGIRWDLHVFLLDLVFFLAVGKLLGGNLRWQSHGENRDQQALQLVVAKGHRKLLKRGV